MRINSCKGQSNTHGEIVSVFSFAKCAVESENAVSCPVISRSALTMIPVNYTERLSPIRTDTSHEKSVLQMK